QSFDQRTERLSHPFGERRPQPLHPWRIPRAVVEGLFSRGRRNRRSSRHIMLGLALTPWASATRARSSSSVRSGRFLTSARLTAARPRSARRPPPARGKAVRRPVSRRDRHHFSTVERLTATVSAISAWESWPASKAAMTRSRRSLEEGLMTARLTHPDRKPDRNLL